MVVGIEKEKSSRRGRVIRYAPFLIWASIIFIASSSTGSAENTSRFIRPLLEFIFHSASEDFVSWIHFLIRKSAHFVFYGILAVLAMRAFIDSHKALLASSPAGAALVATLLIASLDEFNQSMNPERTGSPADVLLDLSGAVVFLLIFLLFRRLMAK